MNGNSDDESDTERQIVDESLFSNFDRQFLSVLDEISRTDDTDTLPATPYLSSFHSFMPTPHSESAIENLILQPSDIVAELLSNHERGINSPDVSQLYSHFFPEVSEETIMNNSLYEENPYKNIISEKGKAQLVREKYSESCKNTSCPILHIDFVIGSEITTLPCGHCFDPEAITTWLTQENASCPVCRLPLDHIEKVFFN